MAVLVLAAAALGQTAPSRQSESQYARELLRLKQVDLMEGELTKAKGTAAENLWKAQILEAKFDELTKDGGALPKVTEDYLGALGAYIKSQNEANLDGTWALDHAQFILAHLSQPILTRMEYFGNTKRDRETLMPLAVAADQLVKLAGRSLEAQMKQIEGVKPFDEKAYQRVYAAAAETRYYAAWTLYFQAMAREPGAGNGGPGGVAAEERGKLLAQAVEVLGEWAVDEPDNGVNFQSYLLRGKAEGEAGDWEKATADFAKAQSEKAPNWVQYQARYQTVVAKLRGGSGGDVNGAQEEMNAFRKWIPKDNAEAAISADMLAYRVAWAVAAAKPDARERRRAQEAALQNVAGIIQRDARFRDLVYEQLAAQVPENADVKGLYPIQQLALARWHSENQHGETPESRAQLTRALAAATAAKENAAGTIADKNEATFLLGVCHALLGNLKEAVGFEVEFATAMPKDPRARQMIDLPLQQVGEMRSAGSGGGTRPATGAGGMIGGLTPEMRALATKALEISTGTFGDKQWLYAQGRMMEEAGKAREAAGVYEKIGAEDRNYLEARYRLVALATERFSQAQEKAAAGEQKAAATDLFAACAKFSDLLDHPPASAAAETVKAAQAYRYNVWLIEAATALTPAVRNTDVALDRLGKLDAAKDKLTETQRGTVVRYQIQAYQLAGKNDKARQVLKDYSKTGAEALGNIRSMALTTVDEIDKTIDPAETKRLASYVVELLNPIIDAATAEDKKDNAFEYRLIQAEMMVKAGQYTEAQTLASALRVERPADIRASMADARAMFAQAKAAGGAGSDTTLFAKSQDYFTRILARLAPGSEAFWESWLRIVESMEAQKGNAGGAEIKTRLGDLKVVYGTKFGGEKFREEFLRLAQKYGVE